MKLNRRLLLVAPFAAVCPATAADQPWQAKFILGGFDGEVYHAGLLVQMHHGWKTYWRVPGSGGIPPDISVAGSNIKELIYEHPLPQRFSGEEGETIGYKHEVVFPMRLVPMDPTKPVSTKFMAFLGICEAVCIPVKSELSTVMSPILATLPDTTQIQMWRQKVPQPVQTDLIQMAVAREVDGKPAIVVSLTQPATDIFVEGNVLHYFNAPQFSSGGLEAILTVNGAKTVDDLKGQYLRFTINTGRSGVEQRLTVV